MKAIIVCDVPDDYDFDGYSQVLIQNEKKGSIFYSNIKPVPELNTGILNCEGCYNTKSGGCIECVSNKILN